MPITNNYAFESEEPKRKLAVDEYAIPSVIRLEKDRLFWQPVEHWRKVKPIVKTFSDFLALGSDDVPDKAILAFARRWGVLNLCEKHKLPVSHDDACMALERRSRPRGEPLSAWRRFARAAASIQNISQELSEKGLGKSADWQELLTYDPMLAMSSAAFTLSELGVFGGTAPSRRVTEKAHREAQLEARAIIAGYVNEWLTLGNVRPHMAWQEGAPVVTVAGGAYRGGLFGALAVHLLELSGRYVIANCSGCREFYHPAIKPKSGQDRYCEECRKAGVPVARAKHRKALGTAKPQRRKQ